MYNVFVAKQSIEIGYSNVGYIRKGSISVIQVKEMLVMARFTLPRDLYFGENALETLKTIKGNKAVLCLGGGSMKRFGFVDKVVEYLKEAGIETKLIEGIEPDPSVETVMKGAKVMQEFEPDLIIAFAASIGRSSTHCNDQVWFKFLHHFGTFHNCLYGWIWFDSFDQFCLNSCFLQIFNDLVNKSKTFHGPATQAQYCFVSFDCF